MTIDPLGVLAIGVAGSILSYGFGVYVQLELAYDRFRETFQFKNTATRWSRFKTFLHYYWNHRHSGIDWRFVVAGGFVFMALALLVVGFVEVFL